jgi:hypothetical protein
MRYPLRGVFYLLAVTLVASCGGDSPNEPEPPFPDVAGVYEISGGFDGIPSTNASFTGTLELTQASRASGALGGTVAIVATLAGDVFNVADDDVSPANVSPGGVISFTAADPSGTWTFTGTLSGNTISQGRHTISDGTQSFSGSWQGTRTATAAIGAKSVGQPLSLSEIVGRLRR